MSHHFRFVIVFLTILLILSSSSSFAPLSTGPPAAHSIDVFFSPRGAATEAVVRELGNSKKEILVQAYSFTSAPIAKALVDAHKRGVKKYLANFQEHLRHSERFEGQVLFQN